MQFGDYVLNVASSNCSIDEKNTAVSDQVFLYLVEFAASYFLFGLGRGASEEWLKQYYEIFDSVNVSGASYIFGQLGSLTKCQ